MKKNTAYPALLVVSVLASGYLIQRHRRAVEPTVHPEWLPQKPVLSEYLKSVFPGSSRRIFDAPASRLTLYALEADDGYHEGKNTFHGFKVLKAARAAPTVAAKLRAAFYANAARAGQPALCFWPHHGIRAEKDGKKIDFVICFSCGWIYSYHGKEERHNIVSADGRKEFNAIFKEAGLDINDNRP